MDKYVDEEYEIQYYGFSSACFIHELCTAVSNLVKTTAEFIKSCIPPEIPEEQRRVHSNKIDVFHSESVKLIKKAVHNLKPSIQAFFAIPKNVSLEMNKKVADSQCTKEAVRNLEEEIAQLERQYMKQGAFIYLCEKELEILESLEPIMDKVRETMRKSQSLAAANKTAEMQKLTAVYKELTSQMSSHFDIQQYKCLAFEGR